jgi:uncharacterized protein (DUF1810 family)
MIAHDPYHLQRFVDAQDSCFAQVRSELAAGKKRTHWMWFVFPQIQGLGSSGMSQRFAISGLDEAKAYLEHPVLGGRLRECTALVNALADRPIDDIFGYPDDLKFCSSVTLFACAADGPSVFSEALSKYFNVVPDQTTLDRLRETSTHSTFVRAISVQQLLSLEAPLFPLSSRPERSVVEGPAVYFWFEQNPSSRS